MPHLRYTNSLSGPLVQVTVVPDAKGIADLNTYGVNNVTPVPLILLVDTAADATLIDEAKIFHWNQIARNFGHVGVGTGNGRVRLLTYRLDLLVKGGTPMQSAWPVNALKIEAGYGMYTNKAHDGLLGRDVLNQVDSFIYQGRLGEFSLHCP